MILNQIGVLWDKIDDTFVFDFKEIVELSQTLSATKRNILKILAMFFDPIGILQPLVINLKILFQKACKKKFDWDEVISEELQEEWKMLMNSFKLIGKLKVSRKIVSLDDVDQLEKLELQEFSDASLQNYEACIYLRSIFKSGTNSSQPPHDVSGTSPEGLIKVLTFREPSGEPQGTKEKLII